MANKSLNKRGLPMSMSTLPKTEKMRVTAMTDFKHVVDRELGLSSPNIIYLRNKLARAQNLYRKELYAHYGCVNAIEFNKGGQLLVSGGDDRRVLLWNVEMALHGSGRPCIMKGEHNSNIFCLGFDNQNLKIFSAGNDEQVVVHDILTGATVNVFLHEEAVYGLSVDPLNDNVFASACDDGRVLIWDIREPSSTEPFCLASYSSAFHAVMYNPMEPRLLATANSKEGVSLWDVRQPRNWLLKYGGTQPVQSCMSVRFNVSGTQILALRRRLPPILFDIHNPSHKCQFDHPGYYNSCTMKSCCFAGDNDQYVLSGSDDFNLYMWKIPGEGSDQSWVDEAHMVLKGHRSIVNQVRFNPSNFLLASSGVEKVVKLWSPFQIPGSSGGLDKHALTADKERKVYTHEEYINLVMRSGQVMTHDYSHQSMKEDSRMMAFFDSLVQREIEGLTSDSSLSGGNSDSWLFNVAESVSLSEIDSSSDPSSDGELPNGVSSDAVPEAPTATSPTGNTPHPPSPPVSTRSGPGRTASVYREEAGDSPVRNGDDAADQPSLVTESISWLIRQKRQQLLQSAKLNCAVQGQSETANGRARKRRKCNFRATKSAATAGRLVTESSSSSESTPTSSSSLDSEDDPEEARNTEGSHQKRITFKNRTGVEMADRRKLLRKRRLAMVHESSDSDSDADEHASLLSHRKRHCFGRLDSERGTRRTGAGATSDATVKRGDRTPSPSRADKTSSVACVAVQQTKLIPLPSEENGETSGSMSTPDSGIALLSYERSGLLSNEAPSTSTSDSSDLTPVRFKKLRSGNELNPRQPRNYRSLCNDKSD